MKKVLVKGPWCVCSCDHLHSGLDVRCVRVLTQGRHPPKLRYMYREVESTPRSPKTHEKFRKWVTRRQVERSDPWVINGVFRVRPPGGRARRDWCDTRRVNRSHFPASPQEDYTEGRSEMVGTPGGGSSSTNLQENTGVCAVPPPPTWPWVRYEDGGGTVGFQRRVRCSSCVSLGDMCPPTLYK